MLRTQPSFMMLLLEAPMSARPRSCTAQLRHRTAPVVLARAFTEHAQLRSNGME